MKIDVEGAEGWIFEGAQMTLQNPNLQILMEFWREGLRNAGTDPSGLLKQLIHLGFEVEVIGSILLPRQLLVSEIIQIDEKHKHRYVDLYLKKTTLSGGLSL